MRLRTTPGSSVPIYRQIVEQIRAHISRGELAAGDPLPSVRAVAEDLVVNANTVAKAYGELVRAGDAVSEPGRGVFVAERKPQHSAADRRRKLRAAVERLVAEAISVGASRAELDAALDAHCAQMGLLARDEEDDDDARSA
jgi:GntR family transcriptional regulator